MVSIMRVSVEGNIGSGKSSLLTALQRHHGHRVYLEPVQQWGEWLSLFYADPGRWGMTFNLKVLASFHDHYTSITQRRREGLLLFERSPHTCRHVFTTLQHADGHMNDAELALFDDIYHRLSWQPDLVLYVRTTPETCMRRIGMRARQAERAIAPDYVRRVHARHEALFMGGFPTSEVCVLDGEQPPEKVLADALHALAVHVQRAVEEARFNLLGGAAGGRRVQRDADAQQHEGAVLEHVQELGRDLGLLQVEGQLGGGDLHVAPQLGLGAQHPPQVPYALHEIKLVHDVDGHDSQARKEHRVHCQV